MDSSYRAATVSYSRNRNSSSAQNQTRDSDATNGGPKTLNPKGWRGSGEPPERLTRRSSFVGGGTVPLPMRGGGPQQLGCGIEAPATDAEEAGEEPPCLRAANATSNTRHKNPKP